MSDEPGMDNADAQDATRGDRRGQGQSISRPAAGPRDRTAQLDEVLIRTLIDSIAVPVYYVGRDGSILYANRQAQQIRHPSDSGLNGMPLAEFESRTVRPDGSPCRHDEYPAIECLRTGVAQPAKTIGIRDESGSVTWVTASAIPLFHPVTRQLEGVMATVVDVSRPIEVERSLKQTEDSYRRLVEGAPDAMVVHRRGRIVFINDAGVKLWGGTSPRDFLGCEIFDFVHPNYRDIVQQRMRVVIEGGTTPLMYHHNVRLDGSTVHVETTAMPCVFEGEPAIQVILRDVTQRRQAERQIRRQREILKTFFQRIPVLLGIFDSHGTLKLANRKWKQVLASDKELPLEELLDRCLPDPLDRQAAIESADAGRGGWRDFSVRAVDGSAREISSAIVRLSSGTRIVIGQDVTRRKSAERELRRNQEELERRVEARTEELLRKNEQLRIEISERRRTEQSLQEKQRFLERTLNTHERDRQLVAYEIHDTFLQGVIGALMYLDAYYESRLPERAAEMTRLETARGLLRKSIEEARRMISGLRPPIIDEQGVVAAIEYLVNEMNARGVKIEFSHEMRRPRLAPLLEAAIFRIVQEGLTNFLRHSRSTCATVELVEDNDELRVTVCDFGVGFDPDQVSDSRFGLQGIKERARLLGGAARIESAPGEGTKVGVTIPLMVDGRAS
jgi:PAS domain S-box-containing protein